MTTIRPMMIITQTRSCRWFANNTDNNRNNVIVCRDKPPPAKGKTTNPPFRSVTYRTTTRINDEKRQTDSWKIWKVAWPCRSHKTRKYPSPAAAQLRRRRHRHRILQTEPRSLLRGCQRRQLLYDSLRDQRVGGVVTLLTIMQQPHWLATNAAFSKTTAGWTMLPSSFRVPPC